jgi:hypothetical protein
MADAVIFEMRKDDFDAALADINPKLATRSGDTLEARLFAFVEMARLRQLDPRLSPHLRASGYDCICPLSHWAASVGPSDCRA